MLCRDPFRVFLPVLLALATGCIEDDPAWSESSAAIAATAAIGAAPGPLTIVSVAAARPVTTTDEQQHLLYELVLQNTSAASVELTRVDVVDPDGHGQIARYRDDALTGILLVLPDADQGPRTIAPGGAAIAYVDLAFPQGRRLPCQLAHRIAIRTGGNATGVVGPTVAVVNDRARSLGPPLHGDRLLDLAGCCDGVHRRALAGIDGGLFLAQRFAIDFVRIDDRATFAGDPTKNDSYFLFGAEVIAAGSGHIVAASDGMAENVPTQPLPPFDVRTAPGNHIVEALDDGRFVLYAHLQNGSVRVHAGDRVRRGQVLGLVGNTGNSHQPHLHFHVMDRASPLASDGLPYAFDRFRWEGTVDDTTDPPTITPVPAPQQRRDRLPRDLDVVAFP
jgi:hypothetical protein